MVIPRLTTMLAILLVSGVLPSAAWATPNLAVSLHDDLSDGLERPYATAGSQLVYSLAVENVGDETAIGAAVVMTLPAAVSQVIWTAAYAGNSEGPVVGAAAPSVLLDLPAGSSATFTIVTTIAADATGELIAAATVSSGSQVVTVTDSNTIVPNFLVMGVTEGASPRRQIAPRDRADAPVRLIDPVTGAILAQFPAFEPGPRGGVRSAIGDLDGDGRLEVIVASGRGRMGEVRVFPVGMSSAGGLAPARRPSLTLRPFGTAYRGGLALASGDFDGDGLDDIAVARQRGDGRVRVFVSRPRAPAGVSPYRSFIPRPLRDASSITLAAGDFGASGPASRRSSVPDRRSELVVVGRIGAGVRVQIRDAARRGAPILDQFRLRNVGRGAVGVTAARVSRDSIPDLIITQRRGARAHVVVHDGGVSRGAGRVLARVSPGRSQPGHPVFAVGVDSDGDGRANAVQIAWARGRGFATSRHAVVDQPNGAIVLVPGPVAGALAHGPMAMATVPSPGIVTTSSGLRYRDLEVGTGTAPSGTTASVTIDYEGWLLDGTRVEGNRNAPFSLNGLISGLREGIATMKVGGRRVLIIPADLAYGAVGTANVPPNSTLVFDVELLATG